MDSVGERIKKIRISKGFTQADLATLLDTTTAAISRYEQSKRELRVPQLQSIADFLGVSIFELYGISSERQAEIEKSREFLARLKAQIQCNLEGEQNETVLMINESLQLAADAIEKELRDEMQLAAIVHRAQVQVALLARQGESEPSSAPPKIDLASKRRNKRMDSLISIFCNFSDDSQNRILDAMSAFENLNSAGQKQAVNRIKELAEMPRYQAQKEGNTET